MNLSLSTIWTLAQKELRDALRNRWFLLYTIAFVVLSLAFSYLALASSGMVGFAGFGRTAASLINLVLLIIPLMALTIGAQSLSGEMERGTMGYLLAQPVGRFEVFLGKYLGLALSLLASLAMGFGISGLVMALSGSGAADPSAYVTLVLLAFLLSLAMLSVGFLISALTRKASVAVGIGLFLWLAFVFLGDSGHDGHVYGAARTHSQPSADVVGQSVAGLQDGGHTQHQRHFGHPRPGRHLCLAAVWAKPASYLPGRVGSLGDCPSRASVSAFCRQR